MRLDELINGLEIIKTSGDLSLDINDITYNSKDVKENSLFVCMTGSKVDGHNFTDDASERGAIAFLVEKDINISNKTIIKVSDTRKALANIANKFFDYPSRNLKLIGVTGTNGKTTITYLVESIFNAYKLKVGVIGTIEYRLADLKFKSVNTTPESLDLARLFSKMNDLKFNAVVMEVSSHSLEMHRVDYCDFDIAIFTNVTHDHLDYHKTLDNYLNAKLKLFRNLKDNAYAIINLDDNNCEEFIKNTRAKIIGYSTKDERLIEDKNRYAFLITAASIKSNLNGIFFVASTPKGIMNVNLQLIGKYNVSNALAAIGCGFASDMDIETIKRGIESVKNVPGRFEKIESNNKLGVFVDYAHTPDALYRTLNSARELAKNKLITVFGCGGDRDKSKRPIMGEIASKLSDIVVITSDNPRTEDPIEIIKGIETGIDKTKQYFVVPDRKEALKKAILELGENGDLVLIAGKGHEDYQVLKDKTIHFSDSEIAKEFLKEKK